MDVKPLTKGMVIRFVSDYVGVSGGDLFGLSYRTLAEFYPRYCDLDVDVGQYDGTKREKFAAVLLNAKPRDQAKILGGILSRFPVGEAGAPETRTEELASVIRAEMGRLERVMPVESEPLAFTVEVVERALEDANVLVREADARSAVDRVHTALHGFVRGVCLREAIVIPPDASLTAAYKALREGHPAFASPGPHRGEIQMIQRAAAAMFDAMGTIRNRGSMAHPNDQLIPLEEAALIVNLARSLLHYIDAKVRIADGGGS